MVDARKPSSTDASARFMVDDDLLDRLQRGAFGYFVDQTNPANGLVADTSRAGSDASIAVVGFALSSYPVAVQRGWLEREEAATRVLVTLRFFESSPQDSGPDGTGHNGFYYHFLDMRSGKRAGRCELSPIDTSFLVAGILTAAAYFTDATSAEAEIRELARGLVERIDWDWATNGKATVAQGWKPESGFFHYRWQGYNEAALLYVLGLASASHPLPPTSYAAWTRTYQWERIYGSDILYAGPLFIHQFSHAWIDFRKIQDLFMREKGTDYFENARRAVDIQREYHGSTRTNANCMVRTAGVSRRRTGPAVGPSAFGDGNAAFLDTPRVGCRTVQMMERLLPPRRSHRCRLLRPSRCLLCGVFLSCTPSGETRGGCQAASIARRLEPMLAAGSPTAITVSIRELSF